MEAQQLTALHAETSLALLTSEKGLNANQISVKLSGLVNVNGSIIGQWTNMQDHGLN